MNLLEFLIKCRQAWLVKKYVALMITDQKKTTIPALSKLLDMDNLTVSLAVTYLLYTKEISIASFIETKKSNKEELLPEYSSREYLLNKEERLKAEKKRVLERVRQALPEEEFTITALARELKEDEYAVLEAIADLSVLGEVADTGRSVRASDNSNVFFPIYVKSKTAQTAIKS